MAAPLEKSAETQFSTTFKQNDKEAKKQKLQDAVFLGCVGGVFMLCGFGAALALSRRKDPTFFAKGMVPAGPAVHETGSQLAVKALGRATLYSVGGFSLLCFTVAKTLGVSNLEDFNRRMKEILPRRKQPEPKGRTEFEGFRDLFTYLLEIDRRKKEHLTREKD